MSIIRKLAVLLFCMIFLCGVFVSGGSETVQGNADSGDLIYLYGENHYHPGCMEKELSAWEKLYESGARHLFIEYSYAFGQMLNAWMQADDDEMLRWLWSDGEDDLESSPVEALLLFDFFKAVKQHCPETVFHGTDIEHDYETSGAEYLAELEAAGKQDSEEYARTSLTCEQGRQAHMNGETDEGYRYRETCLTENFIYELERLEPQTVMGIYGFTHVEGSITEHQKSLTGDANMAARLAERYGSRMVCMCLSLAGNSSRTAEPVGPLTINGKTYETFFVGEHDFSMWAVPYRFVSYWRLRDSWADFEGVPEAGTLNPLLPACDRKLFGINSVYCAECTAWDGNVERYYFRTGSGEMYRYVIPYPDVKEE